MQVRVWNDNDYPFTDPNFKGDKIHIEPHKFVMMEFHEAHEFRGKYSPIILDGDGGKDPRYYKKIRIEKIEEGKPAESGHPCQACGKVLISKEALEVHIDEMHLDEISDKEVADKRKAKTKKEAA